MVPDPVCNSAKLSGMACARRPLASRARPQQRMRHRVFQVMVVAIMGIGSLIAFSQTQRVEPKTDLSRVGKEMPPSKSFGPRRMPRRRRR